MSSPKIHQYGWLGIFIAILGCLIPTILVIRVNDYMVNSNDIGLQEGGGWIFYFAYAAIVTASEIGAIVCGIRAWHTMPGKVAVGLATIAFLLLMILLLSCVLGVLGSAWSSR